MKTASSKDLEIGIETEELSKLIHRVGHDIGNPLTSIISLSSIIERFSELDSLEPDKLISYSKTINKEAWKINRLSECLVNMLSDRKANIQKINLEQIIDKAVSKANSYFSNIDNLEFDIEVPANFEVNTERDQLVIALREIIRNHIQACLEDEREIIKIEVLNENDNTIIKVSSETKLELEIKDLFKVGTSGFKKVSNTGVGLYTVACILNRLGGYCELESNENSFISKLVL